MSKVNRYEYEGKVIEIPLRWDEHSKKEIEDYSLFIEQSPIYTPEGRPILLLLRTPVLMLKWWMMIPQVLTAVPASTSGSHPDQFWVSAIMKKCAPVQQSKRTQSQGRRIPNEKTILKPALRAGPLPGPAARHGGGGGGRCA